MKLASLAMSRRVAPYVFLLPFAAIFAAFHVYPMIYGFVVSFYNFRGLFNTTFIGFENYVTLAGDPRFHTALLNTTKYVIGTLVTLIPIPMVLAVLLHTTFTPARRLWQVLLFLPAITSLVVVGALFRLILMEQGGLMNYFLGWFGVPPQPWLNSTALAIPSLVLVAIWRWTGVNIVYYLAGLTTIPKELYDAAHVDGAGPFYTFFRITLPLLKPVSVFLLIISTIGGFQLFTEVWVLWPQGSGPGDSSLTMVLYLYQRAFSSFALGYAATLGVVLSLIIMAVSLVQFKLFGFFREVNE